MKDIDLIWQPLFQQDVYRNLLYAMSRPGRIVQVNKENQNFNGVNGVLSCLLDQSVLFCDHNNLLEPEYLSLLNAQNASVEKADFILVDGSIPPDFEPRLGTLESPDFSATIIILVQEISKEKQYVLAGPGVETSEQISFQGLNRTWVDARQGWVDSFPLGVDMIFVDISSAAALPRTTVLGAE